MYVRRCSVFSPDVTTLSKYGHICVPWSVKFHRYQLFFFNVLALKDYLLGRYSEHLFISLLTVIVLLEIWWSTTHEFLNDYFSNQRENNFSESFLHQLSFVHLMVAQKYVRPVSKHSFFAGKGTAEGIFRVPKSFLTLKRWKKIVTCGQCCSEVHPF